MYVVKPEKIDKPEKMYSNNFFFFFVPGYVGLSKLSPTTPPPPHPINN